MNLTHLHLLITHLPIFGSIIGAFVLLYGISTKSYQTMIAAYYIFIVSALGAAAAYFTGEAAEETVEDIKGVVESTIKEHEEIAYFAFVSLLILGLASIVGLFLAMKKSTTTRTAAIVIVLLSLVSFGLVARTGYLGGQIRHTELSNSTATQSESSENETDD